MARKIKNIVSQCRTCKANKYNRHPPKPEIQSTPIPEFPGQIVHLDILLLEKHTVLTAVDKFSKYAQAKIINSKAADDMYNTLRDLMFSFGVPQYVIFDNEKAFNSSLIKFMLENQMGITIYTTPPYTSTSNGQVEKVHATLVEIMRCINNRNEFKELLDKAVYEYNRSVHSVTTKRPIDVFFSSHVASDPAKYEQTRLEIMKKIKENQVKDLRYSNKHRQKPKDYNVGEEIFVSIHKRLGSKLTPRYKKEIVKENRNSTVLTLSNRVVHKSHIRT